MTYNYRTKGVCSKEMHIELNDDHTIKSCLLYTSDAADD